MALTADEQRLFRLNAKALGIAHVDPDDFSSTCPVGVTELLAAADTLKTWYNANDGSTNAAKSRKNILIQDVLSGPSANHTWTTQQKGLLNIAWVFTAMNRRIRIATTVYVSGED